MPDNTLDTTKATAVDRWWTSASNDTRARLSKLVNASESLFRQWRSGRRNLSAARAGDVAAAMLLIAKTEENAPRPLTRGDLCKACRECEYFKNGEAIDVDDLK
jgi:hypothetical protein